MRRVLHVIRTDGLSGAEGHLCVLVDELRAQGWASDVLISTRRPERVGGLTRRLEDAGATATVVPCRRDVDPRLLLRLWRARRSDRWDVIHTHLVHADWHAGLAAEFSPGGRPVVSTKHNHDPFRTRRAIRAVERRWTHQAAGVIAISDSLADFVEWLTGRRPDTVRYGLSPGDAPPARRTNHPEPPRFVAIGRLEPQKGFDVLIDAVADTAGVRVDILGAGSLESELRDQVQRLGLQERVRLLGQRDDVGEQLLAADAFVHAARWEGFGLVLLEAMRAALPVVATRVGAIPEVVQEGETALLVGADDRLALAAAMAAMRDDDDLRLRLGAAGRKRLTTVFAPARMAAETAAVYDAVIAP